MNTKIICAIIALLGVAISAGVSYLVARNYTKNEIRRLKLTWEHEDDQSVDAEFQDMIYAVTRTCQFENPYLEDFSDAAGRINKVRSSAHGNLALKLDALYSHFISQNFDGIDAEIDAVITERRTIREETS